MDRCEIFVCAVDCGSFTRAAELLGYTQSAVSQSIRALEQELSCVLLLRSRSGIELTAEGETLLPYIRGASGALSRMAEKARELKGLNCGTVRIGTYSSISRCLLPPLIRDFKKLHPDVLFEMTQGHCEEVEHWVRERRVDLGFSDLTGKTGLTELALLQDAMMRGAELLTETGKSISEIALDCGFDSPSYFSGMFRRSFGMEPCQKRESCHFKSVKLHRIGLQNGSAYGIIRNRWGYFRMEYFVDLKG